MLRPAAGAEAEADPTTTETLLSLSGVMMGAGALLQCAKVKKELISSLINGPFTRWSF